MLRVSQMEKLKVFKPRKGATGDPEKLDASQLQKIGIIHLTVCSPNGRQVVGFMVRRPDIAGMVKQKDVFLARDSFAVCDYGLVATRGDDSYDDQARERLQLDWEKCIIWAGMDAKTTNGRELGWVNDFSFDAKSGNIKTFYVGDGGMASSLVGFVEVPVSMLRGYQKGFMLLDPEAAKLQLDGGFAAKAGQDYARAKIEGKKAGHKAAKAADNVVQKGAYGLGKLIGKAKRSIEAAQEEDEEEQPKVAPVQKVASVSEPVKAPALDGQQADSDDEPQLRTFVPASQVVDGAQEQPAEQSAEQSTAAREGQTTSAQAEEAKPKAAANSSKPAQKHKSKHKPTAGEEAARAFGRGLGRMNSMFGSFVDEYKKSSK
ncbi:MAG: PRC-barrel domain containing protein [Atopobiaceae bacterium]